jgi:hypothetical protein
MLILMIKEKGGDQLIQASEKDFSGHGMMREVVKEIKKK